MFKTFFSIDKKMALEHDVFEEPNDFDDQFFYLPFIRVLDSEKHIFIIDLERHLTDKSEPIESGTYYFADVLQLSFLLNSSANKNIKISLLYSNNNAHREISEVKEITITKDITTEHYIFIFICENGKQYVEKTDELKNKSDAYLRTIYKAKKWKS